MVSNLQLIIAELGWSFITIFINRTMHMHRKPCHSFFMVNVASGMDHGHGHPTITTLQNMAAIPQLHCSLGLQRTYKILDICVMVNWQLSKQGIQWPVSCDHMTGLSLELIKCTWFFKVDHLSLIGSQTHVRLIIQSGTGCFKGVQILFTAFVLCSLKLLKLNRKPNNINLH